MARNWTKQIDYINSINRAEFAEFRNNHNIQETLRHYKVGLQTYYKIAEEINLKPQGKYKYHTDGIMRSLNKYKVKWDCMDFTILNKVCEKAGV